MKTTFRFTTLLCIVLFSQHAVAQDSDREYWVNTMTRIVHPVFYHLSHQTLRTNMPVETQATPDPRNRKEVSHLEALGRAFCGIAPWLNLPPDNTGEGKIRADYTELCIKAIRNAVDPNSPDYLPFGGNDKQTLVDAAFFAQGLLRSKDQIWPQLDQTTQARIIRELKDTRKFTPGQNNWLLFSAMVEAGLLQFTGECEMKSIQYAFDKHEEWYKGDGWFGDGKDFHLDYYNSYVIQPMMIDILSLLKERKLPGGERYELALKRIVRYAVQQEKLISPEGTYPVLGRSMSYRFGCFQVLSQVSLMQQLPESIAPAQVRSALTSVIKRQLVPESFDQAGWLRLGFCGHQPSVAESYISTGSLYLCSTVFLPLGLSPENSFWTGATTKWSSQRAWQGEDFKADKAIKN